MSGPTQVSPHGLGDQVRDHWKQCGGPPQPGPLIVLVLPGGKDVVAEPVHGHPCSHGFATLGAASRECWVRLSARSRARPGTAASGVKITHDDPRPDVMTAATDRIFEQDKLSDGNRVLARLRALGRVVNLCSPRYVILPMCSRCLL